METGTPPATLGVPLLVCAGAYLLGSIPTGLILARRRGVDIRTVGSGNIGATNVARALGKPAAILVLALDALKGFVPVLAARQLGEPLRGSLAPAAFVALVGLCAIAGHMFPIFLRGKGGKGVATSLGVAFGLSPPVALLSLVVYALTFFATRWSSLGSLLGMWSFPCFALAFATLPAPYVALSIATAALVTHRHRDNIGRLLRGEEKRT